MKGLSESSSGLFHRSHLDSLPLFREPVFFRYYKGMSSDRNCRILVLILFITVCGCSQSGSISSSSEENKIPAVDFTTIPAVGTVVNSDPVSAQAHSDPPTLGLLGASSGASVTPTAKTLIKKTFWGSDTPDFIDSLISSYSPGATNVPTATVNLFWGNTKGSPGGMSACRMTYAVADQVGRVANSGQSSCYLQKMTALNLGGAVSRVSGSTPLSTIFSASTSNRIVKVTFTGLTSSIFAKVYGTSITGANRYKADIYYCDGANNAYRSENYDVDFKLGTLTSSVNETDLTGYFSTTTLTAGLISDSKNNGLIAFDGTSVRTLTSQSQDYGTKFKGKVIASDNTIKTFRWTTDGTDYRKDYSYSQTSGSIISDLKFIEGAYGELSLTGGVLSSLSSGIKYDDPSYVNTPSNKYMGDVEKNGPLSLTPDAFFTGVSTLLSDVSVSLTTYPCTAKPDDELTYNTSHKEAVNIENQCRLERFEGLDMCEFDSLNSAKQIILADPNSNL